MSGKNQYLTQLNWQSANPATGFLPLNNNTYDRGSVPSGVANGSMSSTDVLYSQILDIAKMDNLGMELAWSGTPTGTIDILASNSGLNFGSLGITISNPAGSADATLISINQIPFKYILVKYTNSSGSGTLTGYMQGKDLN